MDTEGALTEIEAALAPLSSERSVLLGRPTVIARMSKFRWRWAATRLHTFVIVSAFDTVPIRSDLEAFLQAGIDYAMKHKGGLPRGLQTGSAAVVVALVEHPDQVCIDWSAKVHGRRFAAMPFPVIADVANRQVHHPKHMVVGGFYASHLRGVVADYITRPLTGAAA